MATEQLAFPAAANPIAMFGDVLNQSRAQAEKSLRVMREEMIGFLNRRHDHNGETLTEYQHAADFAGIMAAQEKWLSTLHRDYLEATTRFTDATRKMFADSVATAQKNGELAAENIKTATHETEVKAAEVMDLAKPHA
jgi:hypothetical protein